MNEFEKVLRAARPPEPQGDEFRQALRRELIREERRRNDRRGTMATRAFAASALGLAIIVVLFVLRPSIPGALHAYVSDAPIARARAVAARPAGSPGAGTIRADYRPDDVHRLLTTAASASSDRKWLDGWYEGQLDPARVKSLEDERLYAVRRFQLTNGRRILVLTEIGGDPREEPATQISSIQDF